MRLVCVLAMGVGFVAPDRRRAPCRRSGRHRSIRALGDARAAHSRVGARGRRGRSPRAGQGLRHRRTGPADDRRHADVHRLGARDLSDSDAAALLLPATDPDTLVVAVAEGELLAETRNDAVPVRGSLSGLALQASGPIVVQDVRADPRTAPSALAALGVGAGVAAPLCADDQVRGVLTVCRRGDRSSYSAAAIDTIASFAAQAGLALELARAREAQEAGRLASDRDRIAQQLNADVIRQLLTISTGLTGLATRCLDHDLAQGLLAQADQTHRVARRIGSSVFDIPDEKSEPE